MVETNSIAFLFGVLLAVFIGGEALAQEAPDSTQAPPQEPIERRPTLEEWRTQQRLYVLDREHSHGEQGYDRGVFRHVTPEMDREYELDMLLYRLTPEEAAYRARADNSLHLRVGSTERDLFSFVSRLHSAVPLDSSSKVTIDGVFQQDAQARRAFLELGYAWQMAPRHTLSLRHTFSRFKADLDLTAVYTYSARPLGAAEVSVTAQNLYNDFIYERLGIDKEVLDVTRSYSRQPYLLSLSYASPTRYRLRGEIVGAFQPLSRVGFSSQTRPGYKYRDDERLHYVGALLEYRHSPVTAGLFYKRDRSWMRRVGEGAEVESDYTAAQTFQRVGAFLSGRWWQLRGRVRAFTGSYRDRQKGDNFSESLITQDVDYDEGQRGLQARLLYDPDRGPLAGLEYAALQRQYDGNANDLATPWTRQWWILGPSNYRLVGILGYRFSHGKIIAGVGYDLDGDPLRDDPRPPQRFDNGFGRLILTW